MTNFNKAFSFDSNAYWLLEYYTVLNRIFAYEFLFSKLDSTSYDQRLEFENFAGEDYWATKTVQ